MFLLVGIQGTIYHTLLENIQRGREGVSIDRNLIRTVLLSFSHLGTDPQRPLDVYINMFEENFLYHTTQLYSQLANSMASHNNIAAYLKGTEEILQREMRSIGLCVEDTTRAAMRKSLITCFIEAYIDWLMSIVPEWMDNHDSSLHLLYHLVNYSEQCIERLRKVVEIKVDETGKLTVEREASANKEPSQIMEAIFGVYRHFKEKIARVFESNRHLLNALTIGAAKFVNLNAVCQTPAKASEALARYCHVCLKSAESNTDALPLDDIIDIFALLEERDTFQHVYAQLLSQRLVYGAVDSDKEIQFMERFKQVCGHEFTYKWQRMYHDVCSTSKDLSNKFASYYTTKKPQRMPCEFNALILTSGSWPTTSLPSAEESTTNIGVLNALYHDFEEFYIAQERGRKLVWLPAFSHGLVRTNVSFSKPKIYDLVVSQWQLGLLTLLNSPEENPSATFQQLKVELGTNDDSVCYRALIPLLKQKFLIAQPVGAPEAQQTFYINFGFSSPSRKLHMLFAGQVPAAPAAQDERQMLQRVSLERGQAIQAAIVRMMKARRQAKYQDIVEEVARMMKIRFTAQPADIKTNLEVLIEKEYVERVPDHPDIFTYLA